MITIRNVVRWIAWQIGDQDVDPVPGHEPPARITVFSTNEN